jgi:hypothetical protein
VSIAVEGIDKKKTIDKRNKIVWPSMRR